MKKKRVVGAIMGTKIDINKPYDKIEWKLIIQVEERLGLSNFIN